MEAAGRYGIDTRDNSPSNSSTEQNGARPGLLRADEVLMVKIFEDSVR